MILEPNLILLTLVQLTVRLGSDKQGHPLEPLDVRGRDVAGAFVVPLPLGIERVQLDAAARVGHVGSVNGDFTNRTNDAAAGSEIQNGKDEVLEFGASSVAERSWGHDIPTLFVILAYH